MDAGGFCGFVDSLQFNDCDELFDVNGGLFDVGVVAEPL